MVSAFRPDFELSTREVNFGESASKIVNPSARLVCNGLVESRCGKGGRQTGARL